MATAFDAAAPLAAYPIATYDHREFTVGALCAAKAGRRVSVCIPARNEEATIGRILDAVRGELVEGAGLVDELLVVDDASSDRTVAVALASGASVVPADGYSRLATAGDPASGKGQAMRSGLDASTGEIVVFLDGDVDNFGAHFVTGLLGPLFASEKTMLVKACYTRPILGSATGGGRVTELVARPILALLFPELAGVVQPLAGEVALRRPALLGLELASGYGVEIAMLIDVAARHGTSTLAQVDLGVRSHRNRPLHELAPQAREVLAAALERAGVEIA